MSRQRNFEGCWTCRARKVKCDLTKPHCLRCTKAKLECAGFDIKLAWAPPMTVSPKNGGLISLPEGEDKADFQRRKVELVKFPPSMLYTTYKQLNQRLDELESQVGERRRGRVGPFGVYDVRRRRRREVPTGQPSAQLPIRTVAVHTDAASTDGTTTTTHNRSDSGESTPPSPLSPAYKPGSIFSKNNNSWVHYELMEYAKLTIVAIKGTTHRFTEQNILHILYPKFFPNLDSDDDWMADIRITHQLFFMDEHTDLWLKAAFKVLTCAFDAEILSFNRVSLTHNYFDTLLIPFLKSVFCEFICCEFANWNRSDLHLATSANHPFNAGALKRNVQLAIVYLVLALSSFKMSRTAKNAATPGDDLEINMDDHLRMSVELRKLAISILNYHLDEYDSNSVELEKCERDDTKLEYEDMFLLALVLQVEIDNCFSVYENFELIYAIGDYIVKNKYTKSRMTHFRRLLINMFKIMYMFFESTQAVNMFNYAISKGDEDENYRDLDENYDLVGRSAGDEDGDDDGDDDDDEDDDDSTKRAVQIKPTIKNLIISNKKESVPTETEYTPMSFTISFNKRETSGYDHAADGGVASAPKKRKVERYVPRAHFTTSLDSDALHLMYGLPKGLLDLFHELIHLTNHKNVFKKRRVFPRNFPRICAEIEDRLIGWKVEDHWALDGHNNPLHRCLELGIRAFHESMIVYHKRLIKEQVSGAAYQPHIRTVIACLKEMTRVASTHRLRMRPTFWVLLVCGSEATDKEDQRQIEGLWNEAGFSQFNYWRGKQILYEIWKRRDIGEEYGFMDMVREWDVVLSLG